MLHTLGHGTSAAEAFAARCREAGVGLVVDVRAFPGSRRHPHFGRDAMSGWLPTAGIAYRWLPALGGRRRRVPESKHVALRNESFRAYADHMESEEFLAGVEELLGVARETTAAVMCSESVWWRCHRRLLSDHLVLVRAEHVVHLMHDGRATDHVPTDGVRLDDAGALVYDVGASPTLFP